MSEKNTIHELSDMIGMIVQVHFETEEESVYDTIKCKIRDYHISDWNFHDKWMEPISLTFSVDPLEELPSYIDPYELGEVTLDRIIKA